MNLRSSALIILGLFSTSVCLAGHSKAEDGSVANAQPSWQDVVRTYEPIYVGYTFDEDDQAYLDFSLSVITPASILFPWESWNPSNKFPLEGSNYQNPTFFRYQPRMYLAFSGRAGQYIGSRESSPVVGKRFNPMFIMRWWQKERDLDTKSEGKFGLHDFFEIAYGHESNGQRIGDIEDPQTEEEANLGRTRFDALKHEYQIVDGDASIARDELSRGWDYLGVRWDSSWKVDPGRFFLSLKGRYYLNDGILQGKAEEYNAWEEDGDWLARYDGKITRKKVDGLRASLRFESESLDWFFNANELQIDLITGYEDPFKRITARVELGFKYTSLWFRTGYNSDLVDYYRKDKSWGLAIKLREF